MQDTSRAAVFVCRTCLLLSESRLRPKCKRRRRHRHYVYLAWRGAVTTQPYTLTIERPMKQQQRATPLRSTTGRQTLFRFTATRQFCARIAVLRPKRIRRSQTHWAALQTTTAHRCCASQHAITSPPLHTQLCPLNAARESALRRLAHSAAAGRRAADHRRCTHSAAPPPPQSAAAAGARVRATVCHPQ
jgi:hypothetical protein